MLGFCLSCETFTSEDSCFCCGGNLLYGIPVRLTASHVYHSTTASAVVGGQTIYVSTEPRSLV